MLTDGAVAKAVFVLLAMSMAGTVHVLWLRTRLAQRFGHPVDLGLRIRGRRVFGDNKRLCGFMALPVAAAMSFATLVALWPFLPASVGHGIWPLDAMQYAGLGMLGGLGFMAGELPNSFLKRQLDIPPGEAARRGWRQTTFALLDRIDSIVGLLIVLSLLVPVPLATWLWVLSAGPLIHFVFSATMYRLGLKVRPL